MNIIEKIKGMVSGMGHKASETAQTVGEAAQAASDKAAEMAKEAGSTVAETACSTSSSAADAARSAGQAIAKAAEKVTRIDLNKDGKIG